MRANEECEDPGDKRSTDAGGPPSESRVAINARALGAGIRLLSTAFPSLPSSPVALFLSEMGLWLSPLTVLWHFSTG